MNMEPNPALSILNECPALLQGPSLLHELVSRSSVASNDAIDFLEHGRRRTISYEALHTLSDALCERIIHTLAGLERASVVVPVLLPQCPELYITLLAILKAGKAFCPLSPETPIERLRFILRDLSPDLVIAHSSSKAALLDIDGLHKLFIDDNIFSSNLRRQETPWSNSNQHLAYVLYTSGSTGMPKAVRVSHRAVTQSLLAHHRHIPNFRRFLQFAASTFDVSIFEIFFTLFRGQTLVGCSREQLLTDLPFVIREMSVDAAELTPTVAANLLHGRRSVPTLKLLLTIGEMLTRYVIDEFGGSSSQRGILWGMYGPTETAIHCTLQSNFQKSSLSGNIGIPLDTVSALIVAPADSTQSSGKLAILPFGATGELAIGGPQVADGYLHRQDLTDAAFIHHEEYGLLYRTGDRARMHSDGTIECFGRIVAGQVKLRGQRVELGEIEQSLLRVDGCRSATVLIVDDILVAFSVLSDEKATVQTLRESCREWLPSYMVPVDIVLLPEVPQLPSGKIDRKALEERYRSQHIDGNLAGSDRTTPVHHVIGQTFGRNITQQTPLFSIGLDSLRAIQLASALRKEGYNVGATDLLSAQDLDHLVQICDNGGTLRRSNASSTQGRIRDLVLGDSHLGLDHGAIADIMPCTPLQESMLAATLVDGNAYCNWVEVELSMPRTFDEIRGSIMNVAQNNEILRTGFYTSPKFQNVNFVQVIWQTLDTSRIVEVTNFTRKFSLGSDQSLLHPFNVQVKTSLQLPRIMFQMHHAIYDGWTFDLLLRDMDTLLKNKMTQPRPQFRLVCEYSFDDLESRHDQSSLTYWQNVLRDYQPLPFPNLRGRNVHNQGLQRISGISSVDMDALQSASQYQQVHPQVLFQAAVAYMASAFFDSADVIIGTVTSGRTIPITNIENIMGPCISSVPLRIDFATLTSIEEMLQQVQSSNRAMLQHSGIPLRDIARLCNLDVGISIFDILFVWQQTSFIFQDEDCIPKIVDSADELEFKLTIEVEPLSENVKYRITYDATLLPEAQIMRLLTQVDELVSFFLQHPLNSIESIAQAFSEDSLSIVNAFPAQDKIQHGPGHAVERWAMMDPQRTALVFGRLADGVMQVREELSYAELNARANQLAHAISKMRQRDDELICVMVEKSVGLYVSVLAVLKLGCGYLPLVPDTPIERMRTILADANISICISDSYTSRCLREASTRSIINIDTIDLNQYPSSNLEMTYNGERLAYAIFTSGSTGIPKGVLVTQDNLMSNLQVLYDIYPTTPYARLLQACSQAFDVSAFEIFFAWYAGMALCSAPSDDLYSDLEHAINLLGVTHLSLTPTVASLVNPDRVPSVKFIVTAGEAVTEHVHRHWAGRGLFQGYGPSETTNICTVRPSVTRTDLINNIGSPFRNTSMFVLDPKNLHILPIGAVGELCFGGSQVFRGYLNRPDLNSEKIFDHAKYGRIYRSGDIGRLLTDDSILSMGRSDDQVKIRGQRVELGEITATVLTAALVEDCITLLLGREDDAQKVVSFWVPSSGAVATKFEVLPPEPYATTTLMIFERLSLNLPSYMVPSHIVPISRIPSTSQSKVDKRLLASAYRSIASHQLEALASESTLPDEHKDAGNFPMLESAITDALAETLQVDPNNITRSKSFFSLGLDSVTAIRFSAKMRERGIKGCPISTILKYHTIARLASVSAHLGRNEPQLKEDAVIDSIPSSLVAQVLDKFSERGLSVEKVLPCTPLQEAMLSKVSSAEVASYCNTIVFDIKGDITVLKSCWALMVKRHGILRTAFASSEDTENPFLQVVLEYTDVAWDNLGQEDNLDEYVTNSVPNLVRTSQPPIRFAIRQDALTNKLIFCCHHALYDGAALTALLKEVEIAYEGKTLPPSIPFERYLKHIVTQDLDAADRYWGTTLSAVKSSSFPNLRGSTSHATKHSQHKQAIRCSLNDALNFCKSSSISLLSLIQASWAKLLHFYLGEEDFCFGNVVSGRALPDEHLDQLVAPCFNTLPVRVNFGFKESNEKLLRQLHYFHVNSIPFQLTPLRRIQSKLFSDGDILFDTLVILQQPAMPLKADLWTLEEDKGSMDIPIVCEIFQDTCRDQLSLTLHYHGSLMTHTDAKIVAETFESALDSIICHPHAPANDTIGFSPTLLSHSNLEFSEHDTKSSFYLHSGFERNVESSPTAIALDFLRADGTREVWTYADLNAKANQIAFALIDRLVSVEDIVPVHISKSPWFYAGILGVLKAGATFSPMHPDLPSARKQLMVSELRPKLILCTSETRMEWHNEQSILAVDQIKVYSEQNPVISGLGPNNLAYCIYTSGSTGSPKAVSMEHHAPMQTIESSRQLVPWTTRSRLLQYAAISFDMCYYDCFLAWTFGFALCAAEQSSMLNDLPSVIQTLDIDLLDLTPSVAATLCRADLPSVKWLYCIGEAMLEDIVRAWDGACVNSYGPTEAAFCTTMFPTSRSLKASIIGRPFPSTSFELFSASGARALPIFAVGELYIGGAQLARGYYGRSDLSENRFVQRNGQRFYKTGDLVRMLGSGDFEFIGRADDQVKIRGLRVELGEISSLIQKCEPNIATVTTRVMKQDEGSKEQLVAFIVAKSTPNATEAAALKARVKAITMQYLPAYMVPDFVIPIEYLPLSAAGKVDTKALSVIFVQNNKLAGASDPMEEPHKWTATELHIREVLSTFCKIDPDDIGPAATIHQLGLDSISAVQVATSLRRQGFDIKAADILRYQNCVNIASHLDAPSKRDAEASKKDGIDLEAFDKQHRSEVIQGLSIEKSNIKAILPCTPFQQGIISQFISAEGSAYFNLIRLRLDCNLALERFKSAWSIVVEKHAMLRTGFAHIRHKDYPFVMVEYSAEAAYFPWEFNPEIGATVCVEQWLKSAAKHAYEHLHLPAWRTRIIEDQGHRYMDLAILHAIFDAHSLRIIFEDVAAAYEHQLDRSPLPVTSTIKTILDASRETKRTSDFWRKATLNLIPTRFPNLAPLRFAVAPACTVSQVSKKTLEDLSLGCRKANTTLQSVGLASWLSILSAYTGEPSVTCGVVLSGRTSESSASAVFPCITTVPVACTVSEDKDALLREVMAKNADIHEHQFTPITDIQRLFGRTNEPLFDTIFVYQKIAQESTKHQLWDIVNEKASVEYPVTLELEPKYGQLQYRLTFLPHILPEEQARLILDQLDHLVDLFIFAGNFKTKEYEFDPSLYSITPAKEPQLPVSSPLLHELVEISAANHPDRVALEFASSIYDYKVTSQIWTFEDLDSCGNKIANMLVSHGTNPGDLVAVCFDKCPEASFAMLGILKAGAAFVALDPGAPSARRSFIVKDSGASLVLSMKAQSADFAKQSDSDIINLDEISWKSFSSTKIKPARPIQPQDRSYCLYTSGTTGTPKGCEITHDNVTQFIAYFQRLFAGNWDQDSRWLQFASFHFDVSVLEQYWSWATGIRLVSAPRDVIFEDLAVAINALNITHIDLTPSLARILHPENVPNLRLFITGGESVKQEILDVWGPTRVIYNGYGPTEATIGCTMFPRVPENGKPSNIGPQFDNVGSYVLKSGSELPVLRGAIGELCVSGKLVGKGYLNRPELTMERFAHLQRFDDRVYRTGDLVRVLHNGHFDFLGRADDQVKLRGQRLETGEINAVVRQSGSGISDVVTLVLKHPKQQKEQLVCFVVLESRKNGHAAIVLERTNELERAKVACHENLPGYMVPTHFVALAAMPLSPNNKAEGKKLKEMYEALSIHDLQSLSGSIDTMDAPWSESEKRILTALCAVLRVHSGDVSRGTSFFELGLDSISMIGFSRELKHVGFANAAISTIMKHTTIANLDKVLASDQSFDHQGSILAAQQVISAINHRHQGSVIGSLSITSQDLEALAPCTPLQQGMIARSMEAENGLYFNTFLFNLTEKLDKRRLKNAWTEAFSSMQILRTSFVQTEDGLLQAVRKDLQLPWHEHELLSDSELDKDLDTAHREWIGNDQTMMKRPFELHFASTPKRRVLAVHLFHALYDGISVELMFNRVWKLYSEPNNRSHNHLFHPILPYGPLKLESSAREFWQEHLTLCRPRSFPVMRNDASHNTIVAKRRVADIQLYETLRRKLNVTAQAIAQACWATIVCVYVKGSATLGIVASGRNIDYSGADHVIGPLFNTIPYQHNVPRASETWSSVIKRTHEFNVAALSYQHTPLRSIMKWKGQTSNEALFDTLFVYQTSADHDTQWRENEAWSLESASSSPDYGLAVEVEQRKDKSLDISLVAQRNVLDQEHADRLLDQFSECLKLILMNPDSIVTDQFSGLVDAHEDEHTEKTSSALQKYNSNNFEWNLTAQAIKEEIIALIENEHVEIHEDTSMFELGLDSIDAIQLSSRLKKRSIDLPVSAIMRALTIANMTERTSRLAAVVSDEHVLDSEFDLTQKKLEDYVQRLGITMSGIENVLPLTPLQEAMVAEMVESNYRRYYNYDVLCLESSIDLDRMKRAWEDVLEHSPILRTRFIPVSDPSIAQSFVQLVLRNSYQFFEHEHLSQEPDFTAIFEDIRQKVLTLREVEPLFRIRALSTPTKRYLILSLPHAMYDGWSLNLLHQDVQHAYYGQFAPRQEYGSVIRKILAASGRDADTFWRGFLAGTAPTVFRRRLSENQIAESARKIEQRSECRPDDVIEFGKRNNVTLQALGQAAFSLVLAYYTGSLDVNFGLVLSGRDDDTTSEMLLPTMNTVAVRTIIHGTLREFTRYVQDNLVNIKQWQHFPLRKAQAVSGVQGTLFESLFIYQKARGENKLATSKLYKSVEGRSEVEFPVCVEMELIDGELLWRCAAKDSVFEHDEAQKFLNTVDTMLQTIVEKPDESTVRSTSPGTSICGLPAFSNKDASSQDRHQTSRPDDGDQHHNSPTVDKIREALALVSKVPAEEIANNSTIFNIGLDSISAIKVSSLLRTQSIPLSVGDMLKAGTLERMARTVDMKLPIAEENEGYTSITGSLPLSITNESIARQAGIHRDIVQSVVPASAGQIYMLSMWANSGGMTFYPVFRHKISGTVSFVRLQEVWRTMMTENEILRTIFTQIEDDHLPYLQVVANKSDNILHDVTGCGAQQIVSRTEELATTQPYAHLLAEESDDSWILHLKIHHALYDGVSIPLLMQRLQDLCNGESTKYDGPSMDRFMATMSTPSVVQERKHFWTKYLHDIKQTHPSEFEPPMRIGNRIEIFKPGLVQISALQAQARVRGVTLQAPILVSYARLYSQLATQDQGVDTVIGLYLANRSHAMTGLLSATFPTVNIVPLRIGNEAYTKEDSIWKAASQIQRDMQEIGSPSRSGVALWEIDRWTGVKVRTTVNFLSLPEVDADSGGHEEPRQRSLRGLDEVKISPVQEWEGEVSRVTALRPETTRVPGSLRCERVNSAYLHGIDIELTVRDGTLDVGIFAPEEVLSLQAGMKLLEDLKIELLKLGGD